MYAIVSIAGQQFKVEKGKKVFVHRLPGEVGAEISFDKVLLISNKDKVSVGEPYVDNAVVLAQILSHLRGDKIQVFKKKRRKGYQVLNGHRQNFTELLIEDISESGKVKKETPKQEKEESRQVSQTETTVKRPKEVEKTKEKDAGIKDKPAASVTKPRQKKVAKTESEVSKTKTVKKAAAGKVTGSSSTTKTSSAKTAAVKTAGKSTESKAKAAVKKTTNKAQASPENKTSDKKKQ